MLEALATWQHKGLKFEHTYNVHWRHGCNRAAAITPKFLIIMLERKSRHVLHTSFTSMRNNRTTSHRKITTYRLSPEMNTWVSRPQQQINDLPLQGFAGTLGERGRCVSVQLCCLMSSDVGWRFRDQCRSMVQHWAIRRSWFANALVNALCNLSRKKSREVAAHFRADFWVGVALRCV